MQKEFIEILMKKKDRQIFSDLMNILKQEDSNQQFDSSPIKNSFWTGQAWMPNHGNTVKFMRYPMLDDSVGVASRNILHQSYLDRFKNIKYKFERKNVLLDDDLQINIINTESDKNMREWANKKLIEALSMTTKEKEMFNEEPIELTEELKDLVRIYSEAEEKLKNRETGNLETLNYQMKHYLKAKEEREVITIKLRNLLNKLENIKPEEDDEEE